MTLRFEPKFYWVEAAYSYYCDLKIFVNKKLIPQVIGNIWSTIDATAMIREVIGLLEDVKKNEKTGLFAMDGVLYLEFRFLKNEVVIMLPKELLKEFPSWDDKNPIKTSKVNKDDFIHGMKSLVIAFAEFLSKEKIIRGTEWRLFKEDKRIKEIVPEELRKEILKKGIF